MLKVKTGPNGARWKYFSGSMIDALERLNNVANCFGPDITITSAMDGKHASDSRHHLCRALDIRTSNLLKEDIMFLLVLLYDKFDEVPSFRIKIELDKANKYWIKPGDKLVFPKSRWLFQHLHIEW